ncbi:hypothetical protein J6590_012207 [Homalodisca vitripennis]|nr:hypothetical protein J6590_012207 [Homalodisca vitripennis]
MTKQRPIPVQPAFHELFTGNHARTHHTPLHTLLSRYELSSLTGHQPPVKHTGWLDRHFTPCFGYHLGLDKFNSFRLAGRYLAVRTDQ